MNSTSSHHYPYNTRLNHALGGVLLVICIMGTISNSVALSYYRRKRVRTNRNTKYFRSLFSMITANDIVICISVFPVIDAALTEERRGYFFAQRWFCRGWFIVWHTVWQISLTAVAVLSLSRLMVIRNPNCKLRSSVMHTFIVVLIACILAYWITVILLEVVFPRYYPGYLYCGVSLFRYLSDSMDVPLIIRNDTRGFLVRKGIISITTFSIIISFCIVMISFIWSLIHLKIFNLHSWVSSVSSRRQYAAAKTVIIFTFVSIMGCTPIMMVGLYMAIREIIHPLRPGYATGADVMRRFLFDNHPILEQYAWPVSMILMTSLNSTVNPLIYYWRVRGFRNYVNELAAVVAVALRRRVRVVSAPPEIVEPGQSDSDVVIVKNKTDPGRTHDASDGLTDLNRTKGNTY